MRAKAHTEPRRSSGARGYFIVAVMFTLAAGAAWFSINRENIREYMQTHDNRELEKARIAELKQRISHLKRQQQSLAFNGVETEKQVRERLNMHKPGEKVVFFVEENEEVTTPPVHAETSESSAPRTDAPRRTASPRDDAAKAEPPAKRPATGTGEIRSIYDTIPSSETP